MTNTVIINRHFTGAILVQKIAEETAFLLMFKRGILVDKYKIKSQKDWKQTVDEARKILNEKGLSWIELYEDYKFVFASHLEEIFEIENISPVFDED